MKKISTGKALLASVLSLVVCMSMFLGSTFAWFNDAVSVGVGKIDAGNNWITVASIDEFKNALDATDESDSSKPKYEKIYVKGNIEVAEEVNIPDGVTVIIGAGVTVSGSGSGKLIISSGATLINNGTVNVTVENNSGGT